MKSRYGLIPKTDLKQLSREVLSRGQEAALPQNLSDKWLRMIGRDIARAIKNRDRINANSSGTEELSGPLFLVATLMSHKETGTEECSSFTEGQLGHAIDKFKEAIFAEIIGRETGVFLHRISISDIV